MSDEATVLVIEDLLETRAILRFLLEHHGFEVIEAEGGRTGVASAVGHVPDVIVLDLAMPGLNGFEVAHILASDPRTMGIPIVAVAGSSSLPESKEDLAEVFHHVLLKPVAPDELVRVVKKYAEAA